MSEADYLAQIRRLVSAVKFLESKLETAQNAKAEPIAIVGLGCRFPGGGTGPEAFWRLLDAGVDAVTEIPAERWSNAEESDAADPSKGGVRWGSFLKDVDLFDPHFFEISPREAASLDPQQRLLLEVTWEALEHAGQVPERLMGSRTGVFVGISTNDYVQICTENGKANDIYTVTGNTRFFPAGRLSYVLGLQGPSLAVDTGCSASLVAVHLACQSLRNGESTLAVAAGVNLMLVPGGSAMAATTGALSPTGRCKTFDACADGMVRGEGCGVVVLKRLSDALADGDRIHALIRGSAVNQDGRSTGLTAPNVLSQQALLRQALESARVSPAEIGYVEMHGTGTPLGDPIEAEALSAVLGAPRPDGSVCALGAVKTNLGHLEAAAGVAGLIKAVLSLQHRKIPPNLHYKTLNPRISLDGTSLVIPQKALEWKTNGKPRFAGVSSFGMGGTNAHVVLEEAPVTAALPAAEDGMMLLPLSAKSPEALVALAETYRSFLTEPPSEPLRDIVYTASVRRAHHAHRLALLGSSREELCASLEAFGRGELLAGMTRGEAPAET
ncbi:MAG TPA: beta-ketoacyl synthase N-terminal-like domain-containing protein, partial [Polyangium sp.]|nr:beta-ketoacyl synthase N-terminal-like domain-containing protein [Polyangium sp.]